MLSIRNWLGGLVLAGAVSGLALTNPDQLAYEQYATARLSDYLTASLCNDLSPTLNQVLQNQCQSLLENNQAYIHQLIATHTTRFNGGLFSLYRTRLAVSGIPMLPAYEFATLGMGGNFVTYRASRE